MAETHSNVFRKEAVEKISSPDQLTDYLRVTNPGIWAVLIAVVLLLGGMLAWSCIGTLETTVEARITVQDGTAQVVAENAPALEGCMPLRIHGSEYLIDYTQEGEYGAAMGVAQVDLPDGLYDGQVVVEQIHPIAFLLESRKADGP